MYVVMVSIRYFFACTDPFAPTSCQPHGLEKACILTEYEEPSTADCLVNIFSFMCYNSLASQTSRPSVPCINCSTMAKQSLLKEPEIALLIMAIVLLTAKLPPMVEAEGWGPVMSVTFYNDMHNSVKMHCHDDYNGDHGYRWFKPTETYWAFTVVSKSDTGADYGEWHTWCGFEAPGKPLTYVDVFVGTGGSANLPCDCFGKDCQWTISEWGIHCGAVPRRYVHRWGQRRQF